MSDEPLRPHVLVDCWCGWHHEMKLASELGWDTSWLGDRLIMTTDDPGVPSRDDEEAP